MNLLPKQIKDPHTLHTKPGKRPPQQNQEYTCPKGSTTAPFLPPREEEEGTLWPEEERDADEEEDVAHG